ncbi:FprA family A-type flavoprotein [Imhoffiella purpurea]|uniref:Putative flavoprotein n=1 Tax=Imhoffiella purpurea TaxID=1249627 RepID=W9VZG0_9GAMM|nr:FprA family A-type flavoprotein [Imhoffiella purpurea]EXJ15770.1 Putative flavoprotein [Imhoffiella purpurea]
MSNPPSASPTDIARRGEAIEILPGVHWIGALDPALRAFDIILRTANGTTYNAYLVRGSHGVAVIDTVKAEFADEFFARLESVADYDEIEVIVLNHLEPDHTGALPELMRRAPQARLHISSRAPAMLKALLKPREEDPLEYRTADTGDEVSLGERTLRFLHTPFLHWPDTQCTYLVEDGVLFSGDVFGCHHCDSRMFNDRCADFRFAFDYYYAHIMRPFKTHVMDALKLIEPLALKIIAPTHGPILRDRPRRYLTRYRELSSASFAERIGNEDPTLVVFYMSSYGNTARMAEAVCAGAEEAGARVSLYDLEGGEIQPFVDLIETADALAFGSPTINGDAVKPIWDLLSSLAVVDLKGKLGAAFGSYGWTGEAVRMIEDRMRGLKMRVPVAGLRIKLIPTDEELEECREFGRALASAIVSGEKGRVIDFADLG